MLSSYLRHEESECFLDELAAHQEETQGTYTGQRDMRT